MSQKPAQKSPKIKVGINGFGRIGRASLKILFTKGNAEVVAINDLTNPRVLAHLLKYDTAYGTYDLKVSLLEDGKKVNLEDYRGDDAFYTVAAKETSLVVGDTKIKMVSEPEPSKLPWEELGVDVVLECTGRFVKDDSAKAHIEAGAKKVVLSAPAKGGTVKTFLMGVNHMEYSGEEIVSNASCTTNCIAPVVQILQDKFGVEKSMMTTIHAVTSTQNIVDGPSKDLRRARAADYNMIPTSTGAAIAVTKVIPELEGVFDGMAVRVPVLTGSLSDVTLLLKKDVTSEEVNKALIEGANSDRYTGIVKATYEPLVSSDIVGSDFSSIVDLNLTKVVDGNMVKVLAWYDNEWGYSCRLVDMALLVGSFVNFKADSLEDGFSIV
ncbi:MAG TPA: type I glyceraldehyde-3-phosphate dehydrogenase [candidate division WWE3 bacterium]|uniref:Glyceraldehyde-3-phosphate dehydrogenase n=1 Tax=candidate division WWE3 bacterium TaxID=2053526 RepID=A0A7C1DGD4_UNCKA|nr:type I glyceraldehyde-3-phosphate dehydrogenase [candidate division WWE3 bacterium]